MFAAAAARSDFRIFKIDSKKEIMNHCQKIIALDHAVVSH